MPKRQFPKSSHYRRRDSFNGKWFTIYGQTEQQVKRTIRKVKTGKIEIDLANYCVFRILPDNTIEAFGMRIEVAMADFFRHNGIPIAPPRESQTNDDSHETNLDNSNNQALDKL